MSVKKKQDKTNNGSSLTQPLLNGLMRDRLKLVMLIIVGAIVVFLLLSLFSYNVNDSSWSSVGINESIQNYGGKIGAFCADFLLSFFGYFAYLIPFLIIYGLWVLAIEDKGSSEGNGILITFKFIGLVVMFFAGSALCGIFFSSIVYSLPQGAGGIIGQIVSSRMIEYFNKPGAILILLSFFFLGITLYSGVAWLKGLLKLAQCIFFNTARVYSLLISFTKHRMLTFFQFCISKIVHYKKNTMVDPKNTDQKNNKVNIKKTNDQEPKPSFNQFTAPVKKNNIQTLSSQKKNVDKHDMIVFNKQKSTQKISSKMRADSGVNGLPSISLLDSVVTKTQAISKESLEHMAGLVEEKLADFGVKAQVINVHPGPVVTRFELNLAPGVKVSKLTSLSQDLARSLSTSRVRVVEVIPGKPYVGVELPNQNREMVKIIEILSHKKFINSLTPLTIALGKDISGEPEVADISKMPHLLVAGTTGSGKSVGINAMIISMLYKAGPEDLRMIMIDPKMLELSVYEGIPHLLTPVVTDMKEAANSLRWCVKEMDRRYALMAALGVRNIAGLNDKIQGAEKSGVPIKDPIWEQLHPGRDDAPELTKMPYIVVVSDEFADMIMVVGKKVEELIARLAQKARAAGIHLILATQRPSVDVVTGLIKANIPTRISFQVSSRIDSRTIIDQQGAEQLLGHGDMLYLPPGSGMPVRIHGAFVSDDEVHRVVGAWKDIGGEPNYIESILQTENLDNDSGHDDKNKERDALYDEALKIVVDSQRASISNIQRRLRIGYNRAARLIEEMEESGVVSEMQPNGMREVIIRKEA